MYGSYTPQNYTSYQGFGQNPVSQTYCNSVTPNVGNNGYIGMSGGMIMGN